MARKLQFHGYNCYSSAIGEYAKSFNIKDMEQVITSQFTTFFDEDLIWKDQWYIGAADGPVDELLQKDIEYCTGIRVIEHRTNEQDALIQMKRSFEKDSSIVTLVDLYYLESVNWAMFQRIGIGKEHNPHFIILNESNDQEVIYSDSYYNYVGKMPLHILIEARSSSTRQLKLEFQYYTMEHQHEASELDEKQLIKLRLERYLDLNMHQIYEEFAEFLEKGNYPSSKQWALDACNSLQSIEDQHSNYMSMNCFREDMLSQLNSAKTEIFLIRKLLFAYYRTENFSMSELVTELKKFSRMEKDLVETLMDNI